MRDRTWSLFRASDELVLTHKAFSGRTGIAGLETKTETQLRSPQGGGKATRADARVARPRVGKQPWSPTGRLAPAVGPPYSTQKSILESKNFKHHKKMTFAEVEKIVYPSKLKRISFLNIKDKTINYYLGAGIVLS